jgi:hypothetical protein
MRRIPQILMAIALIVAYSCSKPYEGTGVITEKQYDDPDEEYIWPQTIDGGRSCNGYGTAQTCYDNPDVHIPGRWVTHPERYLFKLRDPDNKIHTIEVPPSVWDGCQVNQSYDTRTFVCQAR